MLDESWLQDLTGLFAPDTVGPELEPRGAPLGGSIAPTVAAAEKGLPVSMVKVSGTLRGSSWCLAMPIPRA
jgi:hypothetical protein